MLTYDTGHKYLVENGVLHRDISAGNVLLSSNPVPGGEGFLTDLDLAFIAKESPLFVVNDVSHQASHPVSDRTTGANQPDMRVHDKHQVWVDRSFKHDAHITVSRFMLSQGNLALTSYLPIGNGAIHVNPPSNDYRSYESRRTARR